jgi:histidinol-phosphate phosphatase family protein
MSLTEKYVFFDRDGTLIEHEHHLTDYRRVVLKPGLGESLRKLSQQGFCLGIITNQSVISRGQATHDDVAKIHKVITDHLLKNGVSLDLILVCPHGAEEGCNCRKPKTGLLESHINSKKINFGQSFMVGDGLSDMQFGINLGVKPVQIKGIDLPHRQAFYVGDNLNDIAEWIISEDSK